MEFCQACKVNFEKKKTRQHIESEKQKLINEIIYEKEEEFKKKLEEANLVSIQREQKLKQENDKLIIERDQERKLHKEEREEDRRQNFKHLRDHEKQLTEKISNSILSSVENLSVSTRNTISFNSLSSLMSELRSGFNLIKNCDYCKEFSYIYESYINGPELNKNDFLSQTLARIDYSGSNNDGKLTTEENNHNEHNGNNIGINYTRYMKLKEPTLFGKTFEICYQKSISIDRLQVITWFNRFYNEADIKISESGNLIICVLLCYKKQSLNKYTRWLSIDGKRPVSIQTIKRKLRLKFRITKSFPWQQDIKALEIGFGGSNRDASIMETSKIFEIFMKDRTNDNVNLLCNSLKKELGMMKVINYTEDCLSNILFTCIRQMKENSDDLIIIGIDNSIIEIISELKCNFRIDLSFVLGEFLVIIEVKFINDRKQQEIDAFECINYKSYAPRLLLYLKKNHISKHNDIKKVFKIGIGYDTPSEMNVNMRFCIQESIDFNLDLHQTLEFAQAMKQNKKRFKMFDEFSRLKLKDKLNNV
jgi:hypothetical protein